MLECLISRAKVSDVIGIVLILLRHARLLMSKFSPYMSFSLDTCTALLLLSTVALELLRRKNNIVASSTRSKHFRDGNKASREFNTLAVKERGKFEREARRYGGVDYSQSQTEQELTQYSPKATMAVVTLLVSVEGDSTQLPIIRSQKDVEEALAKIASDVKVDGCLQSAEILWTPEERNEVLTMKEVVSDYPELRNI